MLAVQQFESKLSANFSQFAIDLTHPDKFLKAGLFDSVQGVVVCKALDAIGQDETFRRPKSRVMEPFDGRMVGWGYAMRIRANIVATALLVPLGLINTAQAQSHVHGSPGTTYSQMRNMTIGSDGTHAIQLGQSTVHSDGSIATRIGNTTVYSDGRSDHRVGNTIINSDGSTIQRVGNATFGSDGTRCIRVGHMTHCN